MCRVANSTFKHWIVSDLVKKDIKCERRHKIHDFFYSTDLWVQFMATIVRKVRSLTLNI